MMLPSEIAKQLSPEEYESVCEKVFEQYKQGFTIKQVTHTEGSVIVEIQLDDRTNHDVKL